MHLRLASPETAIATKKLFFCYMIKTAKQIKWIEDQLKDMIDHSPPGFLTVILHVTKPANDDDEILPGYITHDKRDKEEQKNEKEKSKPERLPHTDSSDSSETVVGESNSERHARKQVDHQSTVELWSGRPDFNVVVERCIAASDYSDWFAVGTCGPTPMNDSLSDAVSLAVKPLSVFRGEQRRAIKLEVEEFGW